MQHLGDFSRAVDRDAFLYTTGLVVRMTVQRHPVIASGSVRTNSTLIGSYACLRAH